MADSAPQLDGVLQKVVAAVTGNRNAAALLDDGRVITWGANFFSSLGRGVENASSGTLLPGYVVRASDGQPLDHIVAISTGYANGLALTDTGQVYAWGDNT